MRIAEVVFRYQYSQEGAWLNQAWLAHKSQCPSERDVLFEKASKARPDLQVLQELDKNEI